MPSDISPSSILPDQLVIPETAETQYSQYSDTIRPSQVRPKFVDEEIIQPQLPNLYVIGLL